MHGPGGTGGDQDELFAEYFLDLVRRRAMDGDVVAFALSIDFPIKLEQCPALLGSGAIGAHKKVLDTPASLSLECKSRNDGEIRAQNSGVASTSLPSRTRNTFSANGAWASEVKS